MPCRLHVPTTDPHLLWPCAPPQVFLSNYHGSRCADNSYNCIPSPLQAITKLNAGGTTVGVPGVDVDSKTNNISAAVAAASAADAVVMLVGIDGRIEGEEHDR